MSVLTIRLPEGKHDRLRNLARARGSRMDGLALLSKLDKAFASQKAR